MNKRNNRIADFLSLIVHFLNILQAVGLKVQPVKKYRLRDSSLYVIK